MGEEYATSKRQSCEGQKTHIWPYCVTMGKNNNPNRYYVQGWLPSHLLSHLIPWARHVLLSLLSNKEASTES